MNSMYFAGILSLLWVFNLMNGTGLGVVYHTIELSQMAAVGLAAMCLICQMNRDKALLAAKRYFYPGMGMAAVFLVSSWFAGYGLSAWDYLWAFLVVYIVSNMRVTEKGMHLVSFCYGGLGAFILFVYSYTDILSGWNANEIAMVGLFSFLVFIIPYFGATDRRSKIMLPGVGLLYVLLLARTDSRSCMIFIVLSLLFTFRIFKCGKILKSKNRLMAVLLVPLGVALLVCSVSGTGFAARLNEWSLRETEKSIFNGRDELWLWGFDLLRENFIFGIGRIQMANWHNSAVECLVAFGVVGYILWMKLFHAMLCDARKYSGDVCVAGSMIAFLLLYCQQSVELGFMSYNPNLLPYVILGILLGRVRYLKERTVQ